MKHEKSNLEHLLSQYISKEISLQEWEKLKKQLHEEGDNTLFIQLEKLWTTYNLNEANTPDSKEINKILTRIHKRTRKATRRFNIGKLLRIAGIIIIVVLSGLTSYLYKDRAVMSQLGLSEVVIRVARGEKAHIILPDSSTVYLNSESVLSYLQNYGYSERNINFSGEAFFDVRKDSKPFTVKTEYLKIEVLGTSFNVYAYQNENTVEMALIKGLVKIQTNSPPIKEVLVRPDEKAVYDKSSGELTLHRANTNFETAWLRNELVFRSQPIEDVFEKLGRRYGVNIHIEGDGLKGDRFTGYFDKDLVGTMEELKTIYEFRYKIKHEDVWVFTER